jgi:hypothetical protein
MPLHPARARPGARAPVIAAARPGAGDDARPRRVARGRPPSPTRHAVADGALGVAPGLFGRRPRLAPERARAPRPNRTSPSLDGEAAYLERLIDALQACASSEAQVRGSTWGMEGGGR